MKFSVVTLFPEVLNNHMQTGVVGTALKNERFQMELINPRQFTSDVHKTVDDRPYGGGDGMVMLTEPLEKCLSHLGVCEKPEQRPKTKVIYLSPQGQPLQQKKVLELSQLEHVVLICGRYAGVDQRLLNSYIDEELSIGDYVLSGGELAACVVIDAVARQLPGVLGHAESAQEDSFSDGLLEAPVFTRPQTSLGQNVPEILLSGNHAKIKSWRRVVALLVTLQKRPDLLLQISAADRQLMEKAWKEFSADEKQALGLKPDLL